MGILGRLFGRDSSGAAQEDRQLAEMVERVIQLSPRLRMAPRYRPRLEAAVGKGLEYLCGLVASLGATREASPAVWNADPAIRAFFHSPDAVAEELSQSAELRALFEREPGLQHAHGVLGMALEERRTLGVAHEGGITRHDVEQTTASFGDHQLRICAASEADLADEIVRRMVDQLALEGLARVAADSSRRDVLEQERKLLTARLRLLERQGTGMRAVVGGEAGAVSAGESAQLHKQMEDNDRELDALGSRTESLDRQLEGVCEVFADPVPLLHVSHRQLRLSRLNVVVDANAADAGDLVEFDLARVPGDPPRDRAFALVRFSRADLRAPRNLLTEAGRLLI
jgi:hypothetical protein